MTDPAPQGPTRSGTLSREHIVAAAIELLDSAGESALTVRALTAHLSTGRGAIYHYVTGREELLAAAADQIVSVVFESTADDPDPRQSLRTLALGIFDALTSHPWVGMQLGRDPLQPAVLRLWAGLGTQLRRMGLAGGPGSNAGATLMNYLTGAAAQYAAALRQGSSGDERRAYLDTVAAELTRINADDFTRETAAALREHDDRAQFLAGIDLILAGIEASQEPAGRPSVNVPREGPGSIYRP